MTIEWTLEKHKIKDLKPNTKNPRYITKEDAAHLSQCLDTFGMIERPIVNQDLTIIGGHQRITILKRNKVKEIECWKPSRMLTVQEVDELCIRLNKNQGSFDYDLLSSHFDVVDLLKWGFNETQLLDEAIEKEKPSEEKKTKKLKTCPACGEEFD